MAQAPTFLWHDYETWGTDPAMDRPAQFAAIRTDSELNPVGEPVMWFARPAMDMLPQPDACLVTGITPQRAWQEGLPEAEFIGRIRQEMMKPGTCSVGYNNIRFDDEFTRNTLYRNFYDPYEREWKNGNSRWDLIDVVRLCGALRPEGIHWPVTEDGWPSYRLEALTAANDIEQEGAHDALVDVTATIALARLIKQTHPKLFSYALSMRNKKTVAETLAVGTMKPVFHVSGMFGSRYHCASVVLPLCMHPVNKNAVIAIDLRYSPQAVLSLGVEEIRQRLYTPASELDENDRIHFKNIHINKCPMVAPIKMVTPEVENRINLDMNKIRQHYEMAAASSVISIKAGEVFATHEFMEKIDPDAMLYSGGFFSDADKFVMSQVVSSKPEELDAQRFVFNDPRLKEMFFRYKARNFPDSLTMDESEQWECYRFQRLTNPEYGATITLESYQARLEALYALHENDEKRATVLSALMEWGDALL